MTYVPAEHWQNTVYIFLLKYIRIFSKILYMQEQAKSILLKSILISIWPSNSRRIIFTTLIFTLYKIWKTKQLIKHSSIIFLRSELWIQFAPLNWQEEEGLGRKPHPAPLPGTLYFALVSVGSWIVIPCSLSLQVSMRVHRTHNSAIYKST
jgi:hypothetical protein